MNAEERLDAIAHISDASRMIVLAKPVSPTTVRGLLAAIRSYERTVTMLLQAMWDARTALGFDPDGDSRFYSTDYAALAAQHVREATEVRDEHEKALEAEEGYTQAHLDANKKTQYGVQVVWKDPVKAGACKESERETHVDSWYAYDSEERADVGASLYKSTVGEVMSRGQTPYTAPDKDEPWMDSAVKEVNRATRTAIEIYGAWEPSDV